MCAFLQTLDKVSYMAPKFIHLYIQMLNKILPTGTFVSIPLSILQANYYHIHSGMYLTTFDILVPLNICLAHAIYDWDRKKNLDDMSIKHVYEKTTSAALIKASCTLNTSEQLQPLIPLLFLLHHFYEEIKREIYFFKPFFVAACWMCAVYVIPVIVEGDSFGHDVTTPLSCFSLLAAWSNFADVQDIDEDVKQQISTPSTILGRDKSLILSSILIGLSFFLNQTSSNVDFISSLFDSVSIIAFIISIVVYIVEENGME